MFYPGATSLFLRQETDSDIAIWPQNNRLHQQDRFQQRLLISIILHIERFLVKEFVNRIDIISDN